MFELSHPVRFDILESVADEPRRMTRICEIVNANSPEVSRHLERLQNSHLVIKEPEGAYRISPLGKLTLSLLPGFTFIAVNEQFLRDHDLNGIPPSLISTIGNLITGAHENGVFAAIQHGLRMTEEAEEHIFFITDEPSDEFNRILAEKHKLDMDIRYILDTTFPFETAPPSPWNPSPETNVRIFDQIPAMLGATEKEASICFRSTRGTCDYQNSFFSKEPAFVAWVNDLFEDLWEKSATQSEFFRRQE
jgi:predicted transcriptional regulator